VGRVISQRGKCGIVFCENSHKIDSNLYQNEILNMAILDAGTSLEGTPGGHSSRTMPCSPCCQDSGESFRLFCMGCSQGTALRQTFYHHRRVKGGDIGGMETLSTRVPHCSCPAVVKATVAGCRAWMPQNAKINSHNVLF